MTARRAVAVAVVAALLAAACAGDTPELSGGPPDDALTWTATPADDLGAVRITVGSRQVGHHQVLGWATYEVAAALGADVRADIARGGSTANREAQLAGLIDVYWETTGTAWVQLLREFGPSGEPDQLYDDVAEADSEENDIDWLAPAGVNTGTALVMAPGVADELGIESLSDLDQLADDPDRFALCLARNGGFRGDPQGLVSLRRSLDVRLRAADLVDVRAGELIELTEVGAFCPVSVVTLTDPQLLDADVVVLEDDVGAFPVETPAPTLRTDVLVDVPDLEPALAAVAASIDLDDLRAMNRRVADGEDPHRMARDWLIDEGLAER